LPVGPKNLLQIISVRLKFENLKFLFFFWFRICPLLS
jgi:hypothetical protein